MRVLMCCIDSIQLLALNIRNLHCLPQLSFKGEGDTHIAMFWSDDELETLQHDEAIELARSMRRRHVDRAGGYGARSLGGRSGSGSGNDIWALSMVHSRSFHIDDGGRGVRALLLGRARLRRRVFRRL